MVTFLHDLSAPNQKIVSGILDMYAAAWADGIPDIDNYVYGVTADALPTLLYEIVQSEHVCTRARGLFPQEIHCATTPELQTAVLRGREIAEATEAAFGQLRLKPSAAFCVPMLP